MTIESDRAEFSGQSHKARFLGNVIIDLGTLRVTGPEAEFAFGGESEEVKSVLIKGGVKVSDVDKWATSQQVAVHFDENRYVFKGSPRLVQNRDELRGEEIVFLDGGKIVKVYNAKAKVDKKHLEEKN